MKKNATIRKSQNEKGVMNECRLIYKSVSKDVFVSNETVESISQKGAINNSKKEISGLLILTGNHFLQVLEGPEASVNELFQKICLDDRHHQIKLINYDLITQRQFEVWSMRLVDLWDISGDTRDFLKTKYPCKDDIIEIPEDPMAVHALLLDAKAMSPR